MASVRIAGLALIAGIALLAVAGCGGAKPRAVRPEASARQPTAQPPSTAQPSALGLGALKPCELLNPVDRSTAGLTSVGKDKMIGKSRTCDWTEPGVFGLTVTLDESNGLAKLKVGKGTGRSITVGAHEALKVADKGAADGTCAVLLAAGDSASAQVDVSNANFKNTDLACQRANTVAKLIEPRLP